MSTGQQPSQRVAFISHSTIDSQVAEQIRESLESNAISCWIAPRDIEPGVAWGEAIVRGICQCRIFILVLSTHANQSKQVLREVERAVENDLIIVPYRIEEFKLADGLEYYLSSIQWLKVQGVSQAEAIDRLTQAVVALKEGRSTDQLLVGKNTRKSARSLPVRVAMIMGMIALLLGAFFASGVLQNTSSDVSRADEGTGTNRREELRQEVRSEITASIINSLPPQKDGIESPSVEFALNDQLVVNGDFLVHERVENALADLRTTSGVFERLTVSYSGVDGTLVEALKSPFVTDFVETPLEEVAYFLQEMYAIGVDIDALALEELGLTPDIGISVFHVDSSVFATALTQALSEWGLAYYPDGNRIVITSEEIAEEKKFLGTYDLYGLVNTESLRRLSRE